MDPDAVLDAIRRNVDQVTDERNREYLSVYANALCDNFRVLDLWMTNGGYKPLQWSELDVK